MPLVSFAQNAEDVILSRVFRQPTGFSIDVGAASPHNHSVTRLFYERGWRGINIEPLERFFNQIVEARPHEINLRMAIADQPDEQELIVCEESIGMSTLDIEGAKKHFRDGLQSHETVPVRTLTQICESM